MWQAILQVFRLEGVRLRSGWNLLRRGGRPLAIIVIGGCLLLLALLYGEYRFFLKVFTELGRLPDMPLFLVIGVLEKLHGMVFLTAFSMLLFSNVLTSVSTTYLASDLTLLHSAPLARGTVFAAKLLETLLLSSYMVWLISLPLFVAFGKAYGSAWRTGLWTAGVLLPYSLPPALLGSLTALLLMRFIPARRAHQALTGLGVVGLVILVVLLRSLRPERLLNPGNVDDLLALVQSFNLPSAQFYPSTWAAVAIVSSLQGLGSIYGRELAKIVLLGLVLLTPLALAADASYFRAFSRSSEGAPRSGRTSRGGLSALLGRTLLSRASVAGRALYLKDLRVFSRDTFQWSQLLLIAALVFVYLFNIRNLPLVQDFPWLRIVVSYLNLGITGFILAAISVRYAFPAVSLEGMAFWVIRSSPVDYRRLVLGKLVLHLVPFLLLAETLVVLGHLMLRADPYLLHVSVAATALMTVGLTGLGIGLGACMPRFSFESAAQVAAGLGGILYMTLALLFIALVLALLFVPVYQHLVIDYAPHRYDLLRLRSMPPAPFYVAVAAVSLATAVLPLREGIRRLSIPQD